MFDVLGFEEERLESREQRTRIVAAFDSPREAEEATARVESLLEAARREVNELFLVQGGVADITDVTRIYACYGFTNQSAWEQADPLRVQGSEVVWDAPAGVDLEEVEALLSTLGARGVVMQRLVDEEPWHQAPHPMTVVVSEEEWVLLTPNEEEPYRQIPRAKKVLH
ncbi:MAG: hypothetical protein MUC50_13190 [Myxococcota bacterium]|jgi:hypothetical protein|nr:hypothetical protein [Myxococcota bacterium]